MTNNASTKPEDILPDDENFADFNGVTIRKGSVAAFLKNIDTLETCVSVQDKAAAIEKIKQLAPAIIATGLHRHAQFKNKLIEDILLLADQQL